MSVLKKYGLPILLLTPLRAVVILIIPFLYYSLKKRFRLKCDVFLYSLLLCFLVSSFLGILSHRTYIQNVVLSIWLVIPVLLLFMSNTSKNYDGIFLEKFVDRCTCLVSIVNVIGLFVFFFTASGDDSYTVPYGHHFKGCHGLAIVNVILFFYYFSSILRKEYLLICVAFFFICNVFFWA